MEYPEGTWWHEPEVAYEVGFKAGIKEAYGIFMDDTYTHIEFKEEKYLEFLAKLKEWGIDG